MIMHPCYQVIPSQQRSSRAYAFICSLRVLTFGLLTVASLWVGATEPDAEPDARYTPEQVVQIVVESLKYNAEDDAGIATVFRFASPGNKASTGPLKRFTQMIKRGYPDMLNHASVRYDPMEITGDTAVQAVWLRGVDGAENGYAFQLGKQSGGTFDGIWMTDAVVPLGKGKQDGIGI